MNAWWVTAAAVLGLTALSFFVFPSHTILQSDTQIYIPILEHIADPTVLTRDIMAVRPHVAFTLYDEAALLLRRITRLSFEHVLLAQQFVYRAVGVLGLFLIATAAALSPVRAWLVAGVLSLGASVMGPMVLLVEYEPVPRGFSLPFILFSIGALSHTRAALAAASAAVALAFHPPTALAHACVLAAMLLRHREWRPLAMLALGPLALIVSAWAHPAATEAPSILGRLSPELEAMQRMRATYNWVELWAAKWMPLYLGLWLASLVAWWRIRTELPRPFTVAALALPMVGLISVPVSYLLLERMKLAVISQSQPGRYLLFVTLFAMLLASIAAAKAGSKRRYLESVLLFAIPLALAATEWDIAKLTPQRLAYVAGLAMLLSAAAAAPKFALAAIAPFFVLPYAAGVETQSRLHTAELNQLSEWARRSTPKDALFQFADAGRNLQPGVFRARALRALYVDWKSGGQVNFLDEFATEWSARWNRTRNPLALNAYRNLGIDYVVFQSKNELPNTAASYENKDWVVYDVRNASTSARVGAEDCAPMRVTEIAAAALAKRRASRSSLPSVKATASAALKVSPAAVVSRASTRKPGA